MENENIDPLTVRDFDHVATMTFFQADKDRIRINIDEGDLDWKTLEALDKHQSYYLLTQLIKEIIVLEKYLMLEEMKVSTDSE